MRHMICPVKVLQLSVLSFCFGFSVVYLVSQLVLMELCSIDNVHINKCLALRPAPGLLMLCCLGIEYPCLNTRLTADDCIECFESQMPATPVPTLRKPKAPPPQVVNPAYGNSTLQELFDVSLPRLDCQLICHLTCRCAGGDTRHPARQPSPLQRPAV
jgi:hypothetical protein